MRRFHHLEYRGNQQRPKSQRLYSQVPRSACFSNSIGMTSDFEKRIEDHNSGVDKLSEWTSCQGPWAPSLQPAMFQWSFSAGKTAPRASPARALINRHSNPDRSSGDDASGATDIRPGDGNSGSAGGLRDNKASDQPGQYKRGNLHPLWIRGVRTQPVRALLTPKGIIFS